MPEAFRSLGLEVGIRFVSTSKPLQDIGPPPSQAIAQLLLIPVMFEASARPGRTRSALL